MSEPTVRRLSQDDLAGAAALETLCFAEPWSATSLTLLLGDTAVGCVACEGDFVAAYGGMLTVAGEGQILNVAVHPECRRRGYARAVVEWLVGYARQNALSEITLEVRRSNAAAIALYEGLGFSVVGERRRFYRHPVEDALLMQIVITKD